MFEIMLLNLLIVLTSSDSLIAQYLNIYTVPVSESSAGDKSLQCVRNLVREQTESAKISTAGECIPLSRSWLETRSFDPDFTYVTGKSKDLQFQPPMLVNTSSYKSELPGLLGVGSSVDVSFSFPSTDIKIYVLLSMDGGNVALKVEIDISIQELKLDHKIDGVWQKDFVRANIVLSVDTIHKLTIRPLENGTDMYLNDNLIVHYYHPDNPFTPEDAQRILISSTPNSGNLHRLKIVVVS